MSVAPIGRWLTIFNFRAILERNATTFLALCMGLRLHWIPSYRRTKEGRYTVGDWATRSDCRYWKSSWGYWAIWRDAVSLLTEATTPYYAPDTCPLCFGTHADGDYSAPIRSACLRRQSWPILCFERRSDIPAENLSRSLRCRQLEWSGFLVTSVVETEKLLRHTRQVNRP